MKPVLKITYVVDNQNLTDEQFENQTERQLLITEDMIIDLIEKADRNLQHGDFISYGHVSIEKV